jgi:hypothetical protein
VREKYCWLIAGGWFVLRETYCWLVADKPNEQVERSTEGQKFITPAKAGHSPISFSCACACMLNRAVQLLREVRRGPVNPFMLGFEILVA